MMAGTFRCFNWQAVRSQNRQRSNAKVSHVNSVKACINNGRKNKSFHTGRKKINFWLLQISLQLTRCSLFCGGGGEGSVGRGTLLDNDNKVSRGLFSLAAEQKRTNSAGLKQRNRTWCPITCIWYCRIYRLIDGDISDRAKTDNGVTYLQVSRRRGRNGKQNARDY